MAMCFKNSNFALKRTTMCLETTKLAEMHKVTCSVYSKVLVLVCHENYDLLRMIMIYILCDSSNCERPFRASYIFSLQVFR
jgi:hypothetical protein